MAIERTLTIIKPDAVAAGHMGDIIKIFEANDFKIVAARLVNLTKKEAEGFYAVHRGKPFFESLTTFMSSGRALVMVLEGEQVISRLREVMGATNPANAAAGTIRTALRHEYRAQRRARLGRSRDRRVRDRLFLPGSGPGVVKLRTDPVGARHGVPLPDH